MGKKKGHGGHHGGAWKVAYADFVTAMMAFFMVLWLCSQSDEVIESTAAYFQNPMGAFSLIQSAKTPIMSEDSEGNGEDSSSDPDDMDSNSPLALPFLRSIAQELYAKLNIDPNSEDKPIDILVTSDGLRIIVYDKQQQPLFIPKTSILTDWGSLVIQTLSWLIDQYPMQVRIDSHVPQNMDLTQDYGPWELTVDRANSTRRALVSYALQATKVVCVSGRGAAYPLPQVSPDADKNQRIELSLIAAVSP
jgi:chemotaxis protein MotB